MIVKPIARPAIDAKVPRLSAAEAKTTQTRKKVRIPSMTAPWGAPIAVAERRGAERDRIGQGVREEPCDRERSEHRARELRDPVHARDARRPSGG